MNTTNELITEAFYGVLVEEDKSANYDEVIDSMILLANEAKKKLAEYLKDINTQFSNVEKNKNWAPNDAEKELLDIANLDAKSVPHTALNNIPDKPESIGKRMWDEIEIPKERPTAAGVFRNESGKSSRITPEAWDAYNRFNQLAKKMLEEYEARVNAWKSAVKAQLTAAANSTLPDLTLISSLTNIVRRFKKDWKNSMWYPFVVATHYFPETKPIVKDLLDAAKMPETEKYETLHRYSHGKYRKMIQDAFESRNENEEEFMNFVNATTRAAQNEIDEFNKTERYRDVKGGPIVAHEKPDPGFDDYRREAQKMYADFYRSIGEIASEFFSDFNTWGDDDDLSGVVSELNAKYNEMFGSLKENLKRRIANAFSFAYENSERRIFADKMRKWADHEIEKKRLELNPFAIDKDFWYSYTKDGMSRYARKPWPSDFKQDGRAPAKQKDEKTGEWKTVWAPKMVHDPSVSTRSEETVKTDLPVAISKYDKDSDGNATIPIYSVPEEILDKFQTMDSKISEFVATLTAKNPDLFAPQQTKFDSVTNSDKFKNRVRF